MLERVTDTIASYPSAVFAVLVVLLLTIAYLYWTRGRGGARPWEEAPSKPHEKAHNRPGKAHDGARDRKTEELLQKLDQIP